MRIDILLVVAALLGSVYSDTECFRSIFTKCSRQVLNPGNLDTRPSLCDDLRNQMVCIADRALLCDMRFFREALRVGAIYDEICAEGDFNNILFEREKECYKKAIDHKDCTDPIEVIRGNQEACGVLNFYKSCVIERVEEQCGAPTLDFFSYLFDAHIKLARGVCHEVILPADEDDNSPDNLGRLNPFQIVTPLFMFE
ncbi:uncharacterized protein LOC129989005 isoform X2 [Argiope bruennichi]|uniref:uncharacterized protein LOC129989005 isoform X2 n=1 Tax=Argiope bruennichi TaxID=94029 RepID=UPI0024954549|nr:uncharacterized protein LOC129989005 isoform X2 [Argiope bruennichi]